MNVWRLITHHEMPEDMLRWSRDSGRIAIGWGKVGHLRKRAYRSPAEIVGAIRSCYPGLQNAPNGGRCLWEFCHEMHPDDLVILSTGARRAAVMRVTGDYEYMLVEQVGCGVGYQHQRRAQVLSTDPNHLWEAAGGRPADGYSLRWTLIRCAKPVADPGARQ